MTIWQHIERVVCGATAEEAVAMRLKLIDRRIEQRLERLVEALEQDDDDELVEAPADANDA